MSYPLFYMLLGVAIGVYLTYAFHEGDKDRGELQERDRYLHQYTLRHTDVGSDLLWTEVSCRLADGDDVELELPDNISELLDG